MQHLSCWLVLKLSVFSIFLIFLLIICLRTLYKLGIVWFSPEWINFYLSFLHNMNAQICCNYYYALPSCCPCCKMQRPFSRKEDHRVHGLVLNGSKITIWHGISKSSELPTHLLGLFLF